jgi:hypothetical protein
MIINYSLHTFSFLFFLCLSCPRKEIFQDKYAWICTYFWDQEQAPQNPDKQKILDCRVLSQKLKFNYSPTGRLRVKYPGPSGQFSKADAIPHRRRRARCFSSKTQRTSIIWFHSWNSIRRHPIQAIHLRVKCWIWSFQVVRTVGVGVTVLEFFFPFSEEEVCYLPFSYREFWVDPKANGLVHGWLGGVKVASASWTAPAWNNYNRITQEPQYGCWRCQSPTTD